MKKCLILSLILLLTLFIIKKLSLNRSNINEYYTINESKSIYYEKDQTIELTYYTKNESAISDDVKNNNYYIYFNNNKYELENVEINSFKIGNNYAHILKSNLITSLINEDSKLTLEIITMNNTIINLFYSNFYITSNKENNLEFESITPSYSFINNELLLVGINITLSKKYKTIKEAYINKNVYFNLNNLIFDITCDNEIDITQVIPNYKIKDQTYQNPISLKSNVLFIPIVYKELSLVTQSSLTFIIDDTLYKTSNLIFIMNTIDLDNYTSLKIKGSVIYE